MSDGDGGVGGEPGGYRRAVSESGGFTGDAALFAGGPVTLYWLNIAFEQNDEYLHLFQQTSAPIAGNVPFMAIGALKFGMANHLYVFGVDGFALSSLAFGISSTLTTFTPTANPTDYLITFGTAVAP